MIQPQTLLNDLLIQALLLPPHFLLIAHPSIKRPSCLLFLSSYFTLLYSTPPISTFLSSYVRTNNNLPSILHPLLPLLRYSPSHPILILYSYPLTNTDPPTQIYKYTLYPPSSHRLHKMFKKSKKSVPAPTGDPHNPHNRLSDNSSSNALVYAHPGDHHAHIPMEHLNDPKFNNNSDPHLHEHDPLPPAVDFSNVTPTARYQFRALARRALSYHSRQRTSNICCLVIWPVLLVVLCLVFSLIGGESPSKQSKIAAFCVNDVDPTTSRWFELNRIPAGPNGSKRVPASWYPSSLWRSRYGDSLPCVRWFGESFPRKAPYENTTVAGAAQPDR